MTRSITFAPAARIEIIEAFDWYEKRASDLGSAFQAEVGRQTVRILENPNQFPVLLRDVRRARLKRFPYSLFFISADEEITIIACFHASRNPRHWKRRT